MSIKSCHEVELIANYRCACGENPLWDDRRQCLFWTDIPTGRLFCFDHASGRHAPIYAGDPVGGFTLQEDGALILFRVTDIARLDEEGQQAGSLVPFADEGVPRFNDVIAAPDGTVFAGTMGKDGRGGVYHVDHDLGIANLWRGTNCSNGMAFTADHSAFFWTDTTNRVIYRYDYDRESGQLANPRPFVEFEADAPGPDGMTLDAEERIYTARFGGSQVTVLDPAGQHVDQIDLPAEKVTACIFGGPKLDELYITTAGGNADNPDGSADGGLFRVKLDTVGRPEFRSRLAPR